MSKQSVWYVALSMALLGGAGRASADTLVLFDAVNDTKSPDAGFFWVAAETGWFYTPSFSYDLISIETKYGPNLDSRTITEEVYDAHPESGGMLLRSAGFTPLANTFVGGTFAPLTLTSGHTYFIGFRPVNGLSVNVTTDSGATYLSDLKFDLENDGTYSLTEPGLFTGQPILRFFGPAQEVPEPASLTLLALGVVSAAGCLWRRRTRAA